MKKAGTTLMTYALALGLSGHITHPAHSQSQPPTETDIRAAHSKATAIRDIEYAALGEHSLKLDLFLPDNAAKPPLLVYIHGGGWRSGSKDYCPMKFVLDYGYALASIEYRLSQEAIFPAQIHDCKAALRFLKANASAYGYDAGKVAVAGQSAGGQLAALIGSSHGVDATEGAIGNHLDQSTRVDAVIDYYGASDFILRTKTQPGRANDAGSVCYELFGGPTKDRLTLAKLASTVTHLDPDDPPYLIFHGTSDRVVLPDQSYRLHLACLDNDVDSHLVIIEGAGHGGDRFFDPEYRDMVIEFLNRTLR
ncbi:MAG TPA: alpha/beta hydrolase [Pontiella sp.]|nr:alpha/beta hydrolase [Pontiella sp.]